MTSIPSACVGLDTWATCRTKAGCVEDEDDEDEDDEGEGEDDEDEDEDDENEDDELDEVTGPQQQRTI